MIVQDASTYPGVVIPCKAIGAVRISQKAKSGGRERNDRVLAVPLHEPRYEDARQLSKKVREELEHFFVSAVFFENKHSSVDRWDGPKGAQKLIAAARKSYQARRPVGVVARS